MRRSSSSGAALYAFIRAREADRGGWWLAVGLASGLGLLSKYAMAYWLVSGLAFLALHREERRHIPWFLGAAALALLIYVPNFLWNWSHGFVSYLHTRDNASLAGTLFHPQHLAEFFGAQFGVFGPVPFAGLLAIVILARRRLRTDAASLLAWFSLPTLAMMLGVSLLSRAQPNWAAPAYVAATVLVVAWLLEKGRGRQWLGASVALNLVALAALASAHDAALALGVDLPAKYDLLSRLKGWKSLGSASSRLLAAHWGAVLMADDRLDMAALLYYMHPRPGEWLKWNGDDQRIHDQFDLVADPGRFIGRDFLLISGYGNPERIFGRFAEVGPPEHIVIPVGGGTARTYQVFLLKEF